MSDVPESEEAKVELPITGRFKVTRIEKLREKDSEYGKKKILGMSLLDEKSRQWHGVEWYTSAASKEPAINEVIEGELSSGQYGLSFKKPRGGGGGGGRGGGRSPGETKAIQRQHSQEMALRHEANCVQAGHRPWTMEQIHEMTDWFEKDITGKQPPPIAWDPMKSDVPGDEDGLPTAKGFR